MTDVYVLKLDTLPGDEIFKALLARVDNDRRDKVLKFVRKEDAVRGLFGDLLVRYVLAEKKGMHGADVIFARDSFGKPFIRGLEDFHFNISHSGTWVVCAVGAAPVGADVEYIAPISMEVADNYFSREECTRLFALHESLQLPCFYELWTAKESYLKCTGAGLSVSLDSFSVVSMAALGTSAIRADNGLLLPVHLKQYEIDPQYKMSVCSATPQFADAIPVTPATIATHFG